uniref:Uncharacterized protein n=1 Tax=Fagus sylvatica TaxID=28930 RepID=A0A2N9ES73_FAGSY
MLEPLQQETKDPTLLDEEIPQESEILEDAYDVKFNFDECATNQSSRVLEDRVLEDTQLDEVDKIATIVLSATEEKTHPFASLIPYIDFVIPDIFSGVVEQQTSLFFMLPKLIPDLKQVLRARIIILQHFKTRGRVFSNLEENDEERSRR